MMVGRGPVNLAFDRAAALLAVLFLILVATPARAEDGYALWLRYAPLEGEAGETLAAFNPVAQLVMHDMDDAPMLGVAADELRRGFHALQGGKLPGRSRATGKVIVDCGTDATGRDGSFTVRSVAGEIRISGPDHLGCLYGAFALLRELSLGKDPRTLDIAEAPAMPLRLLDHWDNPDGTIERGY